MNKFFKINLIFFILIIYSGCSFDTKSGIWKEKKQESKNIAKITKLSSNQERFANSLNTDFIINFNSLPKQNNSWPMSGLNLSNFVGHLSFDEKNNKYSKKKIKAIQQNKIKEHSLVIGNNYYITNDSKGTITKYTNNEKSLWSKNVYNKKEKKLLKKISLTVFEDVIYVIDDLGKYYSLNLNTGKLIWINQHKVPFISQIKVFDNKIFTIDGSNTLRCYSAIDGKELWNIQTEPAFIKTDKKLSIVLNSNSVIFTNTLGDIVKANIENGRIIWFMPMQNTLIPYSTNFLETSDIVLRNKSLYFSNNFSKLYSLSLRTGESNWEQDINSILRPIIIDDILFTISTDGYLVAIDALKGNIIRSNYILDKFKRKQLEKLSLQGFLVASNKIIITTNLGYIILCSLNTGKVDKILKISNSELSEPLISNNKLHVVTKNSVIVFDKRNN